MDRQEATRPGSTDTEQDDPFLKEDDTKEKARQLEKDSAAIEQIRVSLNNSGFGTWVPLQASTPSKKVAHSTVSIPANVSYYTENGLKSGI